MAHSYHSPARSSPHLGHGNSVHAFPAQVCPSQLPRDQRLTRFCRWLINNGREDEALAVLSRARGLPPDSEVVQIEFLWVSHGVLWLNSLIHCLCTREIKAQHLFEKETSEMQFPQWQDGSFSSNFKLGLHAYLSLLTTKREHPS